MCLKTSDVIKTSRFCPLKPVDQFVQNKRGKWTKWAFVAFVCFVMNYASGTIERAEKTAGERINLADTRIQCADCFVLNLLSFMCCSKHRLLYHLFISSFFIAWTDK